MRIVLDTNTLISATLYLGNEAEIMRLVEKGEAMLQLSPEIVEEYSVVLSRPKFHLEDDEVNSAIEYVLSISEIVIPSARRITEVRDPKDRLVLNCVTEAKAEFLITGDSNLHSLRRICRTKIVTSREFLDLITARPARKRKADSVKRES